MVIGPGSYYQTRDPAKKHKKGMQYTMTRDWDHLKEILQALVTRSRIELQAKLMKLPCPALPASSN